jgi:hypothetical protein
MESRHDCVPHGLEFRSYRSFSKTEVADFSNQFYQDTKRDMRNYEPVVAPHTLLGKLEGNEYLDYWFGFVNGSLALGGGCWQHSSDTIVLLARLAVLPKYRMHLLIQHLLRTQLSVAPSYQHAWITFNPHNVSLYRWFERQACGRSGSVTQWPPVFRLFKPHGVEVVNHTPQYVCSAAVADLLAF